MDLLDLLLKPFLVCLILSAIHVYLGLHVIERGVIFVDLALAQVAALGACCGFLLGFGLHSGQSYLLSLSFTIVAGLIFCLLRRARERVPQEAYIGIVYAVASAGTILALSFAPEGGEELKSLLVGHLLFVDWDEIIKVTAIYSTIALIHWHFRHKFFTASQSYQHAKKQGINVTLWDFLFYATFGVVVTSSVELAGVLLVFTYLIVPSVCGALLADSVRARLSIGWLSALVSSIIGLIASYQLDLPTGASIVVIFGLILCACKILQSIKHRLSTITPTYD